MKTAILLISHGSVEKEADIATFVGNIRRGRPTPQSIVDEVTHRFRAIGGSPLLEITRAQAAALEARLGLKVAVGMRLFHPYANDVIAALAQDGIERVVSLPLAPYSVHIYNETAREACSRVGVTCVEVPPWGEEPALLEAFAASIGAALQSIPSERRAAAHVVLTAHSLPMRVVKQGDPYELQVRATARGVMRIVGAENPSHVAFQSQGMDGGDWLGPDLPTTFAALSTLGVRDVVICAIGFLADHTEILYDLDIEARGVAQARGITLTRAASLNTTELFIDALEHVSRRALSTLQATA
ncbi:MAG: ferrochelatase [Polyangiales bacterium]